MANYWKNSTYFGKIVIDKVKLADALAQLNKYKNYSQEDDFVFNGDEIDQENATYYLFDIPNRDITEKDILELFFGLNTTTKYGLKPENITETITTITLTYDDTTMWFDEGGGDGFWSVLECSSDFTQILIDYIVAKPTKIKFVSIMDNTRMDNPGCNNGVLYYGFHSIDDTTAEYKDERYNTVFHNMFNELRLYGITDKSVILQKLGDYLSSPNLTK